jgi:hypothetical protein
MQLPLTEVRVSVNKAQLLILEVRARVDSHKQTSLPLPDGKARAPHSAVLPGPTLRNCSHSLR